MSVQNIKSRMPDYAKDIKLNLSSVLSEEGAEGLNQNQIYGIALASAYATKNQAVIEALTIETEGNITAEEINAAKAAATIMGMNNVYYRFTHMVRDKDYLGLPAKLRMNVIGRPGIEKVDFELYSLAVSAINGCGMCLEAHVNEVIKAGISKVGVQSTVRIAAVINAAAQAIVIEDYS
ncbi:carboxymuconolactone decarboxylase family protein [Emcibacter nanhaiensis]|uniref:Alkyl hydroperoxide reductase AhpD n=1 Tax=Emcibacter nanhaiensis TaxID=1505037 RepID=A0A501PQR3_9PROT|nr:carboxymuconolactone decarboxylase family protein [Emcibacter nanhaiensis]TPD62585.1 alkyl hydroperoxide reductase [Emcibacter nanhaiensis]